MPGVSTAIWGPSLWRILHTISFAPPNMLRHNAQDVITFLTNLAHVLPCKWCRQSYTKFLHEMTPLNQVIREGRLARWMYELHAKVNKKLKASTPPFKSIVKRFTVRPVQWCAADVWDTISLFGLNFTPEKRDVYAVFWATWPVVLRLGVGVDTSVADLLDATACPCATGDFIATCLVLEAQHRGMAPPTPAVVAGRTARYNIAVADNGCLQGVCA